jgi:2-iminobutanoate/2-iminopropanoate deaminase
MKLAASLLILLATWMSAQSVKGIFPKGVNPVGPYSPGVLTNAHLYVSGQGAARPDASMPETLELQIRQTLDNVETVVRESNLTMAHIAHMEIYLLDVSQPQLLDRILKERFPQGVPPHVVVGVALMPVKTPVEINAIAVRDLKMKQALSVPDRADLGTLAHGRIYLAGVYGATAKQVFKRVNLDLRRAGSAMEGLLMGVVYHVDDQNSDRKVIERFAKKNEIPMTMVRVASLPNGAKVAFSGIFAKEKAEAKFLEGCRAFMDTVYCNIASAWIQNTSIAQETESTLEQGLSAKLRRNGASLNDVVASHVFLNDLSMFTPMNAEYIKHFQAVKPSRTTLQPFKTAPGIPGFRIWIIAETR